MKGNTFPRIIFVLSVSTARRISSRSIERFSAEVKPLGEIKEKDEKEVFNMRIRNRSTRRIHIDSFGIFFAAADMFVCRKPAGVDCGRIYRRISETDER